MNRSTIEPKVFFVVRSTVWMLVSMLEVGHRGSISSNIELRYELR